MDTRVKVTKYEPRNEVSNYVVYATSKGSDQPAHTRSLIRAFASDEYSMRIKLLILHHLEFLILNEGCTGSYQNATLLEIMCHGSYVHLHCIE